MTRAMLFLALLTLAACRPTEQASPTTAASTSSANAGAPSDDFNGGFPSARTAEKAFDELDLNRAVHAYRFFYPTVSGAAIYSGQLKAGVQPNKVFGFMDTGDNSTRW